MEKVTVKLQCPNCGKRLSAVVAKGINIATKTTRCAYCNYIGKGAEFMFSKLKSVNENVCPKCGTVWRTRYGSKEILVCPNCGNTENSIPKLKMS